MHSAYAKEARKDTRGPNVQEQLAELRQLVTDKDAQIAEAEDRIGYLESEVARLEALTAEQLAEATA